MQGRYGLRRNTTHPSTLAHSRYSVNGSDYSYQVPKFKLTEKKYFSVGWSFNDSFIKEVTKSGRGLKGGKIQIRTADVAGAIK